MPTRIEVRVSQGRPAIALWHSFLVKRDVADFAFLTPPEPNSREVLTRPFKFFTYDIDLRDLAELAPKERLDIIFRQG